MFLIKIAQWIASKHAQFFTWVAGQAESKPWFAVLLTVAALYELIEHVLGPALAILWATGHIDFK